MLNKLKIILLSSIIMVATMSCRHNNGPEEKNYSQFTKDFIQLMDNNPECKQLLEQSIAICKKINPDTVSNPVQNLSQYYDFVEWSTRCMPWNIAPQPEGRDILMSIDQSLNYFYWLIDQDLPELTGKDYYHPSLQYHEPFRSWLIAYTKEWGRFLSTAESWNDQYLATVTADPNFGLQFDWYESPSKWHSFNDFFARHLSSPAQRPIAHPDDDAYVTSPADSEPQGVWDIDADGMITQKEGVVIKSRRYRSTEELLGMSQYRDRFKGGKMTHTFLNVHDYHRYHSPMSGTIKEILNIPGDEALGGEVTFDPATKKYVLDCAVPQWQSIETRSLMILDNPTFGLVAIMPIGMSQVCSCNWLPTLKVGQTLHKGDEIGYFLFGGSDIVLLFQEGVTISIANDRPTHLLTGEEFCMLSQD